MWIIINGDLVDGFVFTGPFLDEKSAEECARQFFQEIDHIIVPLTNPREFMS